MVAQAVKSLAMPGRYVFVARRTHDRSHNISRTLRDTVPGCDVVLVDHLPAGPAASVLEARHLIDDNPLLIANVDQYLDWTPDLFRNATRRIDGLIATHYETDRRFSYVESVGRFVTRTAEKDPISDQATCGVYWFRSGTDFLTAADRMIAANDHVNGEFYVAPVYNYLIAEGARIGTYPVRGMVDMGLAIR